jgi:hypothetical protein
VPAKQETQAEAAVRPGVELYVPAPQLVQSEEELLTV